MARDPVSGVLLDPQRAVATREHGGEHFYFATQESVDLFDDDPHFYGHPDRDDHLTHHEH